MTPRFLESRLIIEELRKLRSVKEPFYCEDQVFVEALRELYSQEANA